VQLHKADQEIEDLRRFILEQKQEFASLHQKLNSKDSDLNSKSDTEQKLMDRIKELNEMCNKKEQNMTKMSNQLNEMMFREEELNSQIALLDKQLLEFKGKHNQTKESSIELQKMLSEKETLLKKLKEEKDAEIKFVKEELVLIKKHHEVSRLQVSSLESEIPKHLNTIESLRVQLKS